MIIDGYEIAISALSGLIAGMIIGTIHGYKMGVRKRMRDTLN